jgi:hypothetical protein
MTTNILDVTKHVLQFFLTFLKYFSITGYKFFTFTPSLPVAVQAHPCLTQTPKIYDEKFTQINFNTKTIIFKDFIRLQQQSPSN